MAKPTFRTSGRRFLALAGTSRFAARPRLAAGAFLAMGAIALPSAAYADCTATGTTVNCTGTSAAYSNGSSGITVNTATSASVTAPLVIGASGTLNNAGTISGSGAYAVVQYGNNATITNTGTISSTGAASGAAAISVGTNSTVTNSGSLTAESGYPAVEFGAGGTFINTTSATTAVVGDIQFGTNTGSNVATLLNSNVTYGLTDSVYATGNAKIDNEGTWTGNFVQTAVNGTVTFNNGLTDAATSTTTGADFTGILQIGDTATVVNDGTLLLYSGSVINSLQTGGSSFTNNGVVTLGTVSAPEKLTIYGNYTQSSTGILNISIAAAGVTTPVAGTNYSQLYAANGTSLSGGTVSLAGTLNLNVEAGFYATGSVYDVVLADKSITTNNLSLTGTSLPFVTFCAANAYNSSTKTCGSTTSTNAVITNSSGQQAYELIAVHTTDYVGSIQTLGLATGNTRTDVNQRAVAGGLNNLISTANSTPSGAEASFLGYVDVLSSVQQVRDFLTSSSPEGYYGYVTALRDEARSFSRAIDLRIEDQNSNHDEDGWWLTGRTQFDFGSAQQSYRTKSNLYGFNLGYDFSGPHHVLGIAGTVSFDSLKYGADTMSGTNRDFGIAAYAGQNFGAIHLTGSAAYNFGHLSANKNLILGDYNFTNTARASEHLIDVNAKVGYQFHLHGWQLEPYAGIDYMNGKVNGFTESSTLLASELSVEAMKANRTDLVVGYTLTKDHGVFRPYARFALRDRISGANADAVTAAYDTSDVTAQYFTVSANDEGRKEFDTDLGVNWVFDDAGSLFVGYQGTIRNHFQSHGINFGIRIEF